MDQEEARAFIRDNGRAILATYRKDGRIQMSPVLAVIDDDGCASISTREDAYKVRNLRRDGRAFLCGITERFFGDWIQIDGAAEIVSLPEAMEGLVDYYRKAAGEHEDWDEYRAAMVRDERCLIRIRVDRAGPQHSA